MVICLENVLEYEQPTKYIVKSENYSDDFALPVLTAGKSFVLGFTDETDGICKASENPVIIFDDFTADCKYVDFDFKVKSSAIKILHKANAEDNLKYYFYAMQAIDYTPFSHKRVWISEYSKFKIKNRSVAEQNNIVKKLDTVATAIDNAKQRLNALDELVKSRFIEMFGDPLSNSKGYDLSDYGSLFELNAGGTPSKNKPEYWENGNISWIGSNMCQDTILYENDGKYITELGFNNSSARMFPKNTVLVALVGATIGKTALLKFETTTNQNVLGIRGIEESGNNPYFVFYYTQGLHKFFMDISDGGFAMASKGFISKLPFPIVDISLQNDFADFVKLIDKSKFIVQKQIDDLQELLDSKMDEYFG